MPTILRVKHSKGGLWSCIVEHACAFSIEVRKSATTAQWAKIKKVVELIVRPPNAKEDEDDEEEEEDDDDEQEGVAEAGCLWRNIP